MPAESLAWYVAYGSNLCLQRFTFYLAGGRPPGARRTYAGCLDGTPPVRSEPVVLAGRLLFSGVSGVWGGGLATFDPDGEGRVAARAYLLRRAQVRDVVAQETRQQPGVELDLESGVPGGEGLYDRVVALGVRDGVPAYTLGSSAPGRPAAPAGVYLRLVVTGLHETFGWGPDECADYLAAASGVAPDWSRQAVRELHPVPTPAPVPVLSTSTRRSTP